jgi:hypothetical protein
MPNRMKLAFRKDSLMLDFMFIAIGIAFLAGAMLYALACERM